MPIVDPTLPNMTDVPVEPQEETGREDLFPELVIKRRIGRLMETLEPNLQGAVLFWLNCRYGKALGSEIKRVLTGHGE